MEVTGTIIQVFPEQTGTSSRGNAWKKREYVLETSESFPKKIFFDFFGDKADQFPLNMGDTIRLSFDIESREWNGRWFTSIRGWKAEKADAQPMAGGAPAAAAPAGGFPTGASDPFKSAPAQGAAPFGGGQPTPPAPTDDLPF